MYRTLITLLLMVTGICYTSAQEVLDTIPSLRNFHADSTLHLPSDSALHLPTDSALVADSIPAKKAALEAKVDYQAKDSIVMTKGNWAFLYGEGNVKYMDIELQSENIELNMDSSLVFAKFGVDTLGLEFGYPIFKNGSEQYEARKMNYNFKSGKGYIFEVITQQGEGFVTAGISKKMPDNTFNMINGRYTTCDHHEAPHFYIQMTKAKVRPGKNIVTGPVYLVIEDVPLPVALPFAFFPFTSSYSSGVLMPTFGDESTRGFYLRDGGYYFALSDYVDLALTGEIYTKGSWGLNARSSYRKRYKYSGSFNAGYQVTQYGDKISDLGEGKLDDYYKSTDFQLRWTHTQDSKANPYRSFSASVNFATSNFDKKSVQGQINQTSTENTKGSTVNFTQRFPNNPFTISATMSVNQRTKDSTLAVTLPDISVSMSRIYPLKRKNPVGSERWYEKISMSYTGYLKNSITTKENQFLKANIIKDWTNSVEHRIPVSASFSLFNYINISPSVNYNERWYTTKVTQAYDADLGRMAPADTTYGFYRLYDYSASMSLSTTLYGSFQPLPIFGDKVQMIRHRFEPSVSLSARPDFGSSRYGFYETYESDQLRDPVIYSPFAVNGSVPPRGKSGSLNFSFDNNIEMKVRSDRDSTGFRKISIIDQLSIGSSYNLAVDSFRWSDISVRMRLKLSQSKTIQLNMTFDPYTYRWDENRNQARKVDVMRWNAGKGIGRLMRVSQDFSYTFNNDTFKKWFGGKDDGKKSSVPTDDHEFDEYGFDNDHDHDHEEPGETQAAGGRLKGDQKGNDNSEYDADGYYISTIPWSFGFSYNIALAYGEFDKIKEEYKYNITQRLSFNGSIQPTKNWRINFNSNYNFDRKKIESFQCNISRTMHCWQMSAGISIFGNMKSYTFAISASSSMLKDLKYNKSSSTMDGQKWY
ncbi:LPS-assembly protein LptD [Parabacteroides sp. OttesenSCG-928-N08]|nr:LPS-assembly protein LptD [Parabacteroides sp. OttesenSCG-928-N08]